MEIKDILKDNEIVGVVSNYKINLKDTGKVKDLNIKELNKGLKIVGLDESIAEKYLTELTISEIWKIDLLSKIHKDTIIVGNLSNDLIYRDREYMKKLFIKLNTNYHKKIVIIDNKVDVFMNLVKRVFVIKNKEVIYETSDFYDDKLYEYVTIPKIVDFVKTVNKTNKLNKTTEIYELLKDIYRSVS